jgi:broad specificity phosphatase PhoE
MSRLLLLRHGESAANADDGTETLSEEDGDRLTERGRKQAEAAGPALRELGAARLLTSPMRRARETAAIVGEALGLEPEVVDYAQELTVGERFEEILARVRRLKDELEGTEAPRPPLLVTHGIFIRFFLLDSLLAEDFEPRHAAHIWQLGSHNCALSTFARDEYRDPAGTPVPGWVCFSWMERPWDRP